jgi:hypothetical protein
MEMHGPDWLHLTQITNGAPVRFGYQWSWRFWPLISYKKTSVFALMQVKRMAAAKSSDLPCIFAESEPRGSSPLLTVELRRSQARL